MSACACLCPGDVLRSLHSPDIMRVHGQGHASICRLLLAQASPNHHCTNAELWLSSATLCSNRTSEWVRETSQLPKPPGSPTHNQQRGSSHKPGRGQQQHSQPAEDELSEDEAAVYVSAKLHVTGKHSGTKDAKWQPGARADKQPSRSSDSDDNAAAAHRPKSYAVGLSAPGSEGPGSAIESASVVDGQSIGDAASEAAGSASSAGSGGHDEDLAVDTRWVVCCRVKAETDGLHVSDFNTQGQQHLSYPC